MPKLFFFWQFKIVIGLGFEQYPSHFQSGVKSHLLCFSWTLIVFSFSRSHWICTVCCINIIGGLSYNSYMTRNVARTFSMSITCLVMFKQLCFTMIKPTLPTHPCNLVDFPHSGCSKVCEEKMNWI